MKFTLFTKIIDEETFVFQESRQEVIRKLREMGDLSYECNDAQESIIFRCYATGKIYTGFLAHGVRRREHYSVRANNIYYVRGEVVSEGNKTMVRIYSVYSWLSLVFRLFCVLVSILVFTILFFEIFLSAASSASQILFVGVFACVFIGINCYFLISSLSKYKMNIELLKEEVRKRLDAVRRWEE